MSQERKQYNLGTYLAERLVQVGVDTYFAVPGDFNLLLLDQLLTEKRLKYIGCCNELNAGYAADGYARAKGIGVLVVTFGVGGLSAVNAVAGSFSDHLPVIVISGGPNSNDLGTSKILHHTLGLPAKTQQCEIFSKITVQTEIITNTIDAATQIDRAISSCLNNKRPVYIEISSNLPTEPVSFPIPFYFKPKNVSNPHTLKESVEYTVSKIKGAQKFVIVVGSKVRMCEAMSQVIKLAEAVGCGVAIMPDAKGMFPEDHPLFIGTYWGNVSSQGVAETVESCDSYIFVGPVFNDYTTTGYTSLISRAKLIEVTEDRVKTKQIEFGSVEMPEFLESLAQIAPKNEASFHIFKRIYNNTIPHFTKGDSPLEVVAIQEKVQEMLSKETAVITETGEAWFTGQKFKLKNGSYEFQMQWGSIGWSVGATLGYCLGTQKRVISLIGDGSFQVSCQELSTMIRYRVNPIIIILNNYGYTIESQIHDGIYNRIQNWNYSRLVDIFNGDGGSFGLGLKATTKNELDKCLKKAWSHTTGPSLIECILAPDDCSKELLEWGTRVSASNSRPPVEEA